jgi:hypothetical protein
MDRKSEIAMSTKKQRTSIEMNPFPEDDWDLVLLDLK